MKNRFILFLLCALPLISFAQNYEQQGDELFAQAQYDKAAKKYRAAIEMSGASTLLNNKIVKSDKCFALLERAMAAENSSNKIEAYNCYKQLYALHTLPAYNSKINIYKKYTDPYCDIVWCPLSNEMIRNKVKFSKFRIKFNDNDLPSMHWVYLYFVSQDGQSRHQINLNTAGGGGRISGTNNTTSLIQVGKRISDNLYEFDLNQLTGRSNGVYYIDRCQENFPKHWCYIPITESSKNQYPSNSENKSHRVLGHVAVDMGLSVRWADCNVGAEKPCNRGSFYAWGEVSTKSSYTRATYKYNNSNKLVKYCTDSNYGIVDNKQKLESCDDAASISWGSEWKIPTKEQWEELKNNCKWAWVTIDNVSGYMVTSNITGKAIFLPVTGYYPGEKLMHTEMGLYWTSTLYPSVWNNSYFAAYRFDISNDNYSIGRDSRSNGRPIRAVCK